MNENVSSVLNSFRIIGRSPLLYQAVSAALQAAKYNVSVLVVGENGTGKEVFHKILHSHHPSRRNKSCIAVNCGALPEGTINSELFGHVKGAYTGATSDRKGFFEEANGGTIFLDEVGELPLDTQARLLRILETGEYQRMGSSEIHKTDVRIVAATNKDLHRAIEKGTFREDLFYRLSTITIHVPALRDRQEDIALLFRYFANNIAEQYDMPPIHLDANAQQLLLAYRWPGNVRQLLHIVEEISIVEQERDITADILRRYLPDFESRVSFGGNGQSADEFLPGEKAALYQMIFSMRQQLEEVRQQLGLAKERSKTAAHPTRALGPASPIITSAADSSAIVDYEEQEVEEVDDPRTPTKPKIKTLIDMERQAIAESLQRNGGNKRKVAEELGISERTIHRKIADYGL